MKEAVTRFLNETQEDEEEEEEEEEDEGEGEDEEYQDVQQEQNGTYVEDHGEEEREDEHEDKDEAEEEEEEEDDEYDEGQRRGGKKRKSKPKASSSSSSSSSSASPDIVDGPGYGRYQLSPELHELLGREYMKRKEVTEAVWKYIKANDLQNPSDRRRIVNDERMAKVFKCREMGMMQLPGKLTPHLKKCEDLVGFKDSPAAALKPPRSAKKARGKKDDGEKPKRRPSSILWRITEELATVVGSREATVDDIRAKINQYIKEKELQNPANRVEIRCDEVLERIMGQKLVTFFSMQGLIKRHRLEKVT